MGTIYGYRRSSATGHTKVLHDKDSCKRHLRWSQYLDFFPQKKKKTTKKNK